MDDIERLIAEAEAALKGVTPGEWSVPGQPDKVCAEGYTKSGFAKTVATVATPSWMGPNEAWANARFIAFARAWVPEAAAALTALSEQNASLAAQVAELTRERDEALSAARQQDKLREATLATLRGVSAALEAAEAKLARLDGALTPSVETKTAYMGEFSIPFPIVDENGDEVMLRPNVPWTTIKEIMAAIRARAALTEGTQDE